MTASFKNAQADARRASSGQMSLFDLAGTPALPDVVLPDIPEYDDRLKLTLEKQKVGMYLSGHPLQKYAAELQGEAWTVEKILARAENPETVKDMEGATVEIAGIFFAAKGADDAPFAADDGQCDVRGPDGEHRDAHLPGRV